MVKVVERIQTSEQILIKKIAAETAQLIKEQDAQIISLSQGMYMCVCVCVNINYYETIINRCSQFTHI
jgi:spore coat polysaccharide biosynthesis predicted glycosyltransferase SpsG